MIQRMRVREPQRVRWVAASTLRKHLMPVDGIWGVITALRILTFAAGTTFLTPIVPRICTLDR